MTTEAEGQTTSEMAREISRGVVNLYKKYTGRGPSHARTHICDDCIVTLLHDTMTPAEETLRDENRAEMVREQRRVFQDAFRKEAKALVERTTGSRVTAFLSDHAIDPDYAAEVFVLDNRGD
jgi:uncharacterized protein YbcI